MARLARTIRTLLDRLYLAAGAVAALFLIAILVTIVLQLLARWTGNVFPGATNYAGYFMAASSFFALAHALNRGSHIRVSLLLTRLGRWRRWGEIWCYGIAAATAVFFARYAIKTNIGSLRWNDISQGQDATPIWIPQIAMSVGATLLAVALIDHFVRILLTDHAGVEEAAVGEGGE
jgi:TRAP-type C4-dicarboxylate transport system permease small subunit